MDSPPNRLAQSDSVQPSQTSQTSQTSQKNEKRRKAAKRLMTDTAESGTMQSKKGNAIVSIASSRRHAYWRRTPCHSPIGASSPLLRCLRRDAEGGGRGRPR